MKNNLVHLFGIYYQSVKYFVLNGSRAGATGDKLLGM
jgi:hypothetical protein